MSRSFYDAVADALTGFLPPSMRNFESYRTSSNLKLWYGDERREHYEVQHIRKGKKVVLEIGFHSEHRAAEANDEVLARLVAKERSWRKKLGKDTEVAPFVGGQTSWRRISELWDDAGPEAAIEAAERLAEYIRALEPLRG